MSKNFKNVSTVVFILAFIVSMIGASVSAASANTEKAGKPGMKGRPQMLKILYQLKLSDEQKKEVAAILKKYPGSQRSSIKAMVEAQEKLSKAIYSDGYNENAVREAYRDVAATGEEMVVLRAKIANEVNATLTPEQKDKLQKLMTMRFNKLKERIDAGKTPLDIWINKHS